MPSNYGNVVQLFTKCHKNVMNVIFNKLSLGQSHFCWVDYNSYTFKFRILANDEKH